MIAKVASGSTQYFLSDRLSARLVLDSSGNVSGRQGHLPFGELRSVFPEMAARPGIGNIDHNLVFDNLFSVQVKFLSL